MADGCLDALEATGVIGVMLVGQIGLFGGLDRSLSELIRPGGETIMTWGYMGLIV